ncbi:uncharacterized protein MYCFIDRAFT_170279 [Pseudocercospora fijiensis CIRAD86]|uniref:Uncharacterized protein n=1 Tax=Pseudocercospora fijiensis (strain CIRAD86) TaxID=383855 RepID=N1Q7L3_PSEFD|nr:uncharacterized protein MYCFIDRAFT_170279 [Pseudocercospora fijiensis CIRAD86]EME88695.1 hypothetical protein MYCFIDRAFT_170279 [Pseudocercospora fijiensis CIRAD86]
MLSGSINTVELFAITCCNVILRLKPDGRHILAPASLLRFTHSCSASHEHQHSLSISQAIKRCLDTEKFRGSPVRIFIRQETAGFSWTQIRQRAPRTTYWVVLDSISITSGVNSATCEERKMESGSLVDVWPLITDGTYSSDLAHEYSPSRGPKAKAHKLNAGMNSVAMLIRCNDLWPRLILILGPVTETFFGYDIILADEQHCSRFPARESKLLDELTADRQLHLPWEQTTLGPHVMQIQVVDVQLATVRPDGSKLSSATNRAGTPRLRPPLLRSNAHDSSFYGSRRDEIHYEKHFILRLIVNAAHGRKMEASDGSCVEAASQTNFQQSQMNNDEHLHMLPPFPHFQFTSAAALTDDSFNSNQHVRHSSRPNNCLPHHFFA